jgi:BioD-like phosphotransacetylase family protein
MISLFLASVTPYTGKNVIAMGLAQQFRKAKKSVGFFKPIGPKAARVDDSYVDEEALFFKKTLKLAEPATTICPVVMSDQAVADLLRGSGKDARETILTAYKKAARGKSVMVCAGMGRLCAGTALGYPMSQFVQDVKAKVIVVDRFNWPLETLDGILLMKERVPDLFAGVVFNRVPAGSVRRIDQAVRPFLKAHGVDVLGIIAEDSVLSAIPVSDLVQTLAAQVLCGADHLEGLIEHFSIGAMTVDAALPYFRRFPNKAVIVGGDRADIQLAALETSTRCLILTGDLYPSERILARAEEAGVPVLLAAMETSAVVEACEQLHGWLSLHNEAKIARANELVAKNLDWEMLAAKTGK